MDIEQKQQIANDLQRIAEKMEEVKQELWKAIGNEFMPEYLSDHLGSINRSVHRHQQDIIEGQMIYDLYTPMLIAK